MFLVRKAKACFVTKGLRARLLPELKRRCNAADKAAAQIDKLTQAMVQRASKAVESSIAAADAALQCLETHSAAARAHARQAAHHRCKQHDDMVDVLRAIVLLLNALARLQDERSIDTMLAAAFSGCNTAPAVSLHSRLQLHDLENCLGVGLQTNPVDPHATALTFDGIFAAPQSRAHGSSWRNVCIVFTPMTARKDVYACEPADVQLQVPPRTDASVLEFAVTKHYAGALCISYTVWPPDVPWFQTIATVLVLGEPVAVLCIWHVGLPQMTYVEAMSVCIHHPVVAHIPNFKWALAEAVHDVCFGLREPDVFDATSFRGVQNTLRLSRQVRKLETADKYQLFQVTDTILHRCCETYSELYAMLRQLQAEMYANDHQRMLYASDAELKRLRVARMTSTARRR